MARKPSAAASRPSQPKSDVRTAPVQPVKPAEEAQGASDHAATAPAVLSALEVQDSPKPTEIIEPGVVSPVLLAGDELTAEERDRLVVANHDAIEAEVERRVAERLAEAREIAAEVLHVTLPEAGAGDVLTAEEFAKGFSFDGRALRVRSARKEGRRRAGRFFTPEPTSIDPSELTADQIGALLADPQLVVEVD